MRYHSDEMPWLASCEGRLSQEEEYACVRSAQAGDAKAQRRLIDCNLRWIVKVARRYCDRLGNLGDFQDLVNEGVLAMAHAIRKFEPARGFRLTTYATWWLQQRMGRYCSSSATKPQGPGDFGWLVNNDIQFENVADNPVIFEFGMARRREVRSAEDQASHHEEWEMALAGIQRLPDREKLVVQACFLEGAAYKDVSSILKVTRTRVRQIGQQAIKRLQEDLCPPERLPAAHEPSHPEIADSASRRQPGKPPFRRPVRTLLRTPHAPDHPCPADRLAGPDDPPSADPAP